MLKKMLLKFVIFSLSSLFFMYGLEATLVQTDFISPSKTVGDGTLITLTQNVTINKNLTTTGNIIDEGTLSVGGTLDVTGDANLNGKVSIKPLTALTKISQAATGALPTSVTFSPSGNFVVVTNSSAPNIQTFSVDASGNLSSVISSQNTTRGYAKKVAWSPSGNFIAVVSQDGSGSLIQIFSVDGVGNISSQISSQALTTTQVYDIAWAPTWSLVSGGFIAITDQPYVKTFSVDTSGNLSTVIGSQPSSGQKAVSWAPSWSPTTGGFIAVINGSSIATYSVDISGNLSSTISSQPAAPNALSIAWAPQDNLIAISSYYATVQIFDTDSSGVLSSIISSQPSRGTNMSNSLAWSPNWSITLGGFFAIANGPTNSVQIFSADTLGNLSRSEVGYANTYGTPQSLSWSPVGDFIIVANAYGSSYNIQIFSATEF